MATCPGLLATPSQPHSSASLESTLHGPCGAAVFGSPHFVADLWDQSQMFEEFNFSIEFHTIKGYFTLNKHPKRGAATWHLDEGSSEDRGGWCVSCCPGGRASPGGRPGARASGDTSATSLPLAAEAVTGDPPALPLGLAMAPGCALSEQVTSL